MAISVTKEPMNRGSNNVMLVLLFLVIGLSLLSLSVPTIMTNAQVPMARIAVGCWSLGFGHSLVIGHWSLVI